MEVQKNNQKQKIVISYLKKSLEYYSHLNHLSKKQNKIFKDKDRSTIDQILKEKEEVISKIKLMDKKFLSYNIDLEQVINDGGKEEVFLFKQVKHLVEDIVGNEDKNQKLLQSRKNIVKNKYDSIIQGKTMIQGYYTGEKNIPRFLNFKK